VFAFCFAGSSFSPASCLLICMTIETCQCHTTSLAGRHHTTQCVPVAKYTSVCIRTGLQPLIIHHSQTPSSPMKQKKPTNRAVHRHLFNAKQANRGRGTMLRCHFGASDAATSLLMEISIRKPFYQKRGPRSWKETSCFFFRGPSCRLR
jgi:hypothetical protein